MHNSLEALGFFQDLIESIHLHFKTICYQSITLQALQDACDLWGCSYFSVDVEILVHNHGLHQLLFKVWGGRCDHIFQTFPFSFAELGKVLLKIEGSVVPPDPVPLWIEELPHG